MATINEDNPLCTVDERHLGRHLADGAGAPDGNDVAFFDTCVDDTVPGSAEDIGEVEALLVGDGVGQGEEVDIAVGDADVFGLTAGKTTREVRVAEHA